MGAVRANENVVGLKQIDLCAQTETLVGGEGGDAGWAEERAKALQHRAEVAHAAELGDVGGAAAVVDAHSDAVGGALAGADG